MLTQKDGGSNWNALPHNIQVFIRARVNEMANIWRKYYASVGRRVICRRIITVYEKTKSGEYVRARFGRQIHDTEVSSYFVLLPNGV